MQKKRPWLSLVIAGAAAIAAHAVLAAGFGGSGAGAVLGQPLDFAVQVRLDAGEPMSPECVSAEVTLGDRRLPAALVRTVVEPMGADLARVRVLTTVAVDEPVVGVLLNAACGGKLSRRFVVLADPPITPSVAVPAYASALPEAPVASEGARAATGELPAAAAPADDVQAAVPRTHSVVAGAGGRPAARASVRTPRPAAGADRHGPPRRAAASAQRAEAKARARRAAAAVAAPEPAPRLKLDLAEPVKGADTVAVNQALEAVAQAASSARAAASAASAADERIATLERTVQQLRTEAKSSREMATQLRDRLGRTEDFGRWLWPLVMSVLLLAALAAWLAWRLATAQRQRQQGWRQAAAPPRAPEPTPSRQLTRPIPFVTSELAASESTGMRPRGTPAWPPPAATQAWPDSAQVAPDSDLRDPPTVPQAQAAPASEFEPESQRTEVLPPKAQHEDSTPRDVSIEELIDLEQQAEFFVVLGQDEAAVDLLVEHLRNTGGGSPLPYLKLLEIYRRRGDRGDYERMRSRFNHRFNAYAPEWDLDLQSGRSLEDYPGVVPRLQQIWARPLDAMAELEALLFRKSRGELFDLPAYREVLFLYSLARDLLDREAVDSGNVDLLLPIADGGEFSSTSPAPFMAHDKDGARRTDVDDRPTAPVDLDLSTEADRPTSIFDALEELPPNSRRR